MNPTSLVNSFLLDSSSLISSLDRLNLHSYYISLLSLFSSSLISFNNSLFSLLSLASSLKLNKNFKTLLDIVSKFSLVSPSS